MSEVILKVEDLSKQYRLGLVGTGTISHDLNRWWSKIRGKEDPFLKVGEVNDRSTKGTSNYVWALKDINFEVNRGEVLGIIGKNGAGKSTLLKILSRVTSPTTGEIKTKGRIASLLEVGTGFHPEMTGRENIYLNGAILGMTKAEIKSKIDEIIEFSGCERYIDTPVKRYSSGMTVRLAFAVAAFLEPDILIIDEVLAVGDAEFQKKAIGKIQDISKGQGRTVLFVSHNMSAIQNLCTRCLVLNDGMVSYEGDTDECIDNYLLNEEETTSFFKENTIYGDFEVEMLNKTSNPTVEFKMGEKIYFKFTFKFYKKVPVGHIGIGVNTLMGDRVLTYHTKFEKVNKISLDNGTVIFCVVEHIMLMYGSYNIEISLFDGINNTFYNNNKIFKLNIAASDFFETGKLPSSKHQGIVVQRSNWIINEF